MANPPRFVVGHHVLFTDTVQKVRKDGGLVTWESAGLPFRTRYWMNEGRAWQSEDTPFTKGVVVGQRFLSDYSVESDTDWDLFGREFTYTTAHQVKGSTRRAWLVSFDLHRKPALVLDEHIRPAPLRWMLDGKEE